MAPPQAGLCGSSVPRRQGPAGRGGASEGKGTRADAGVDTLVQGQVVALLQVQEEEPVRGLAWVKALVLQSSLLDLEGACGGGEGCTQQREVLGIPNSPSCPTPPGCCTGRPLSRKHSSPFCLLDSPLSFKSGLHALSSRKASLTSTPSQPPYTVYSLPQHMSTPQETKAGLSRPHSRSRVSNL